MVLRRPGHHLPVNLRSRLSDIEPPPEEIHILHPQRREFPEPEPGVREDQDDQFTITGSLRETGNLLGSKESLLDLLNSRQFYTFRRIRVDPLRNDRVGEDEGEHTEVL